MIVTWKKDDWLAFISARSFNNEGITSDKIRCIRIFFRADDGRMYSIELYPHDIRLIIYDNLREYWLTPTEKRLIHGVCDVIKLSRLVSSCELVHVITDLPQVEVDDRDATGNSVPLFWIRSNWF